MKNFLFIFCLFLSACATLKEPSVQQLSTGDYRYVKEYMTSFIEQEMDDGDMIGLSIALVDDQKIVWKSGVWFCG